MNKQTIIIIIFILILAGVLYYYYSIYEPKIENESISVSISAIDKERIKTGYEIQPLGIFGNTTTSYEQLTLPKGLIQITNRNIGKQSYYENTQEYNLTGTTRIDLILEKPELPKIEKTYEDSSILLDISSKNFQDVDFCLKGSINYIFLKAEPRLLNYFEITNNKENITIRADKYNYLDYPEYQIINSFENYTDYNEITLNGYGAYDVCYDGEFSLKNNNKILNVSYTKLSTASESDFIKILLVDKAGNELVEKIK